MNSIFPEAHIWSRRNDVTCGFGCVHFFMIPIAYKGEDLYVDTYSDVVTAINKFIYIML